MFQYFITVLQLYLVIFLDFHSAKQGLPLVDSWSRGLEQNQMYLDRDTFISNVPRSDYITARDESMVWKVVWQKAGKTLPVFFFVNEHNNLNKNTKPQAKKQRFLKSAQKRNNS